LATAIVNLPLATVYRYVVGESQGEAALVNLAANGDGEAFACLYGRYKRNVWELSYYLCQRNHHDAEEAMQETFLKAWRSLRHYRGAGTFKSWLLKICRNVCIDRVHRAPERPLALERCGGDEIADRRSSSGQVDAILLRTTVAGLPPDEREAWFLVDVLGCTSEEAAQIVGARAASTVRSRVTRARQQILDALNEEPDRANPQAGQTEVYGIHHSPLEKAIVVALIERSAFAARLRPARFVPARRLSVALADGCKNGTSNGIGTNVAHANPVSPEPDSCNSFDLVRFFDALDSDVPSGTRLIAIVDGPMAATTTRWCEEHPHWELLRAPAHASWRKEAELLLGRCVQRPAVHAPSKLLALLATGEPFVWTHNRNGVAL
jgi:RNA polymerase sigma-70 factor (ECF subfamily)